MSDDELLSEVMRGLEIDHQYVRHFDAVQTAEIAELRRVGRAAGRKLGWKVRTFQTHPEQRDDRKVVVIIVVIESTADDQARLSERSALIIRNMDFGI